MGDEGLEPRKRLLLLALVVPALVALFYYEGFTGDWKKFYIAAHDWMSGDGLYRRYGFFYFPWSMALIAPLSLLPMRAGMAIFNAVSLLCLFWSVEQVTPEKRRLHSLAVALLCPFTLILVYMSQWDALTIAASVLAFKAAKEERPWVLGAALVVMATKPTNVWLPALLALSMIRGWKPPEIAKVFAIPAVVGASSFLVAGLDWPLRYWEMLHSEPPRSINVSMLRFDLFGVPLWPVWIALFVAGLVWLVRAARRGPDEHDLVFALSANLVLTLYALPYHFAQTAPAIGWLMSRSIVAGAVGFVLSVLGAWAFWEFRGSVIMNLYPAAIVALLYAFRRRESQESTR